MVSEMFVQTPANRFVKKLIAYFVAFYRNEMYGVWLQLP